MRSLAIILAVLLCLPAWPAEAVLYRFYECGKREAIAEDLGRKHAESRRGGGIQKDLIEGDVTIELFVSESGSWTMLYSYASGRSCLMAFGTDWSFEAADLPPGPDADVY